MFICVKPLGIAISAGSGPTGIDVLLQLTATTVSKRPAQNVYITDRVYM
jgi:hypothetical protein